MWVVTVKPFANLLSLRISIHTTHVGGDEFFVDSCYSISISIHTTHVGGDGYKR